MSLTHLTFLAFYFLNQNLDFKIYFLNIKYEKDYDKSHVTM